LVNKVLIIILLFGFDFISKKIVFYNIDLNSFLTILPILDLTHIHNYGISFGLLSGVVPPALIISIGLVVTIIIFIMMIKSSNKIEKWGFLMIISGAISNIIDRALNSYVLDFIYMHYKNYYWPAFNLADIYISLGVLMIIIMVLIDLNKKIKKNA